MDINENETEIKLFCSTDEYEISQVCAILTENNIPFIKKETGSGAYMNLYMGKSIQEKTIIVAKKDYDKALELMSIVTSEDINSEEVAELKEEVVDNNQNKYKLVRRAFGLSILGLVAAVIILLILFA